MNTSQIKNFAIQSRKILMEGVLNRIISLGFDIDGKLTIDRPIKIQGGTVFMGQLQDEGFYEAWSSLEQKIKQHKDNAIKNVCEEAAYTWFNRLVAIRIMQKNKFIEPVMQYVSETSRIPMIVDEARSGRLSLNMSASDRAKLDELLRDSTKTNEQFNLLISAFCEANPVIYKCFGGIEKYIKLLLPDNILAQGGFIDLLNNTSYLTEEDYKQSELIGWLYQFYISEKKDEVFAKKGAYDADEIPAATQIFTPNWIVKYMVQNTLGRIYLDNNPYSALGDNMKYLVKTDEPFPEDAILHINDVIDYKLIDPACGSGHILVEVFDLLFSMYQEEAYPTRKAIEQIFTRNIIGIDLDTRAKQLATFALLMKACIKDRSFLDCKVMPRVLDMPEPFEYVPGDLRDFLPHYFLGGNKTIIDETEIAFELLKQAKTLGSIMKFDISPETRFAIEKSTTDWEEEGFTNGDIVEAIKSMNVILALTDKYSCVVANPPYMGSGSMNSELKSYVNSNYESGKADLFSVFMLWGMDALQHNGKMGMINMQSWMFLSSFDQIRELFIDNYHFDSLLHLGPRTFDELSGEVVQNVAFISAKHKSNSEGYYYRLFEGKNCAEKEQMFVEYECPRYTLFQDSFRHIPGATIGYWLGKDSLDLFKSLPKLSSFADLRAGISTGDNERFYRLWYECDNNKIALSPLDTPFNSSKRWFKIIRGGDLRKWYGSRDNVINLYNECYEIANSGLNHRLRTPEYYIKPGLTWNRISSKAVSVRVKTEDVNFGENSPCMFMDEKDRMYVMGLLNSCVSAQYLSAINPTLSFQAADLNKLPVRIETSNSINTLVCNSVSIAKQDWDAHETSWDFTTNELLRMKHNCGGNVADLDLLEPEEAKKIMDKYKVPTNGDRISDCLSAYKSEWTRNFNRLHYNEEELNRQFIEIYGLQDELTPDVPLNEITILQQGEISIENNEIVWHDDAIIKQLLSYAVGCWMGRYRLDREGLNIAHYPTPEEVCSYDVNGYTFDIDDDAIIPLMGKDTPFEDDNALQKIVNFVKYTFGEDNISENLNFIENCLGKSIEDYLIKDFWKDHKKMYQNRPIYWLFSSKKGAFQVLSYMHRMNPYTVEKIRTKYLLPYIEHLKGKIEIDEARGSDLTTIERKNLTKMKTALDECIEYHDRLHDVALKAIDFDLDDGVVVNYAKFGDVLAKIK